MLEKTEGLKDCSLASWQLIGSVWFHGSQRPAVHNGRKAKEWAVSTLSCVRLSARKVTQFDSPNVLSPHLVDLPTLLSKAT